MKTLEICRPFDDYELEELYDLATTKVVRENLDHLTEGSTLKDLYEILFESPKFHRESYKIMHKAFEMRNYPYMYQSAYDLPYIPIEWAKYTDISEIPKNELEDYLSYLVDQWNLII